MFEAQIFLNIRQNPTPLLSIDGSFGPKTNAATRAFQQSRQLGVDGIIGPNTQAALRRPDPLIEVSHGIRLIPQPTNTTCWAASTAMMTNSTVPAVIAQTPADMIASDGGLLNSSGSDQAVVTGTRHGKHHGLKCNALRSWVTAAFAALIQRGPIMLDMLWNSADYAAGSGSPGHMIVVSGVFGDRTSEKT